MAARHDIMDRPHARLAALCLVATLGLPGRAGGAVRTFFSGERGTSLDAVIVEAWAQAELAAQRGDEASIDVAVFSFTTQELGDELLRIARDNPTVRVRLLVDLSQISLSQRHMAPYIEHAAIGDYAAACRVLPRSLRDACEDRLALQLGGDLLDNVTVAYKVYDAYVYGEGGRVVLEHRLSRLMHHKMVVVNGSVVVTGSYNFSPTAASKNYENLMVFTGVNERDVAADFAAELEALWTDPALVLPGAEAREWRRALIAEKYAAIDD